MIRVETPAGPPEIVVNDGSVPESDMTNNTFKVEAPEKLESSQLPANLQVTRFARHDKGAKECRRA